MEMWMVEGMFVGHYAKVISPEVVSHHDGGIQEFLHKRMGSLSHEVVRAALQEA